MNSMVILKTVGNVVLYCKRMKAVSKKLLTPVFYRLKINKQSLSVLHRYNVHIILNTCLLILHLLPSKLMFNLFY